MSFTRTVGQTRTQHGHYVELERHLLGLHDYVLVVHAGEDEPTRLPLKREELSSLVKMLMEEL